ncbi:hypothetical protein JTB14_037492, partial [Gonioctena quinquepunctata]
SQEVRDSVANDLNIPYGPGNREVMDIYGTDLPPDSPIFIHFHGGFWQEPSVRHNNNSFIAKILWEKQIKSIFVGYELCPNVRLDNISGNIEKAMRRCLEYAKNHNSRVIHLSGHSAGAQIVANLFIKYIPNLPESERKLFKSAFLLAGVYDLMPLLQTKYNGALNLDKESAKQCSPLYQKLEGDGTEFYVVVAENDSPQFLEQGKKMHEHLKSLSLRTHFVYVETVDHFDLIENLNNSEYLLSQLILKYCSEIDE